MPAVHKTTKHSILAVLALVTMACAAPSSVTLSNGETIQAGMKMILHERLLVPAYKTSSYIQDGRPVLSKTIDHYRPYCRMEMRDLADPPRHIEPGEFLIERIAHEEVLVQSGPWHVASSVQVSAGGATAEEYHTIFYLSSSEQPGVARLFCSHWEDPTGFPRHLSAQEIRWTLDPVITIQ